jgi:MFS family permease
MASASAVTPLPTRDAKLAFILVLLANLLDGIDFAIVQVALPTIQNQFAISLADSQWVISAYAITFAGFVLLSGRAGDTYGHKKVFVWGMALFTFASLGAGLAPSVLVLVLFRLAQGVGAAMTTVAALAIVIKLFREERERVRYFGIFVASLSAGTATGVLSGGVLTFLLGWRWVFFVNVPIGIAVIFLSLKHLASDETRIRRHLDIPGAFAATSGLILFVYALTSAADLGLGSLQTVMPLGLSLLVLVALIAIEYRTKDPLLPLGFLRRGSTFIVNAICFFVTCTAGVIILLTIYFQLVLGWTPLQAGVGILPMAIIFFIGGAFLAARVQKRLGLRRTLLFSMTFLTSGAALLTQVSAAMDYFVVFPGMMIFSFGASLGFPAIFAEASVTAAKGEEGLASSVINTSFRVGFPAGLAVLFAIVGLTDPTPTGTFGTSVASGLVTGLRFANLTATIFGLFALLTALAIKGESKIPAAKGMKTKGNGRT